MLFLPEASDYIAANAQESLDLGVSQASSPFILGLREAAKTHSLAVHVGIHDVTNVEDGQKKLLNSAIYIHPDGSQRDEETNSKLHVFDYGSLRESATVQPGKALTAPFSSPIGLIGSLICFDVRFPETSLALTQPTDAKVPWFSANKRAQVITFPSAFTLRTGEAHWEILLRARAIETQSWVFASAQVGKHNEKRASWGQSMVVDPWGRVVLKLKGVKEGGEAEEGAVGELGFVTVEAGEVEKVRGEMPLKRRE